jgi:hypothetical protein
VAGPAIITQWSLARIKGVSPLSPCPSPAIVPHSFV